MLSIYGISEVYMKMTVQTPKKKMTNGLRLAGNAHGINYDIPDIDWCDRKLVQNLEQHIKLCMKESDINSSTKNPYPLFYSIFKKNSLLDKYLRTRENLQQLEQESANNARKYTTEKYKVHNHSKLIIQISKGILTKGGTYRRDVKNKLIPKAATITISKY